MPMTGVGSMYDPSGNTHGIRSSGSSSNNNEQRSTSNHGIKYNKSKRSQHKEGSSANGSGSGSGLLLRSATTKRKDDTNGSSNFGSVKARSLKKNTISFPRTSPASGSQVQTTDSNSATSSGTSTTKISEGSDTQHIDADLHRDDNREARSREAARLAALVMNVKLSADDSKQHSGSGGAAHGGPTLPITGSKGTGDKEQQLLASTSYSSGTSYRARKTRAKLELQYQMIRNYQYHDLPGADTELDDDIDRDHLPITGVYNPLQTIRNRVYRSYTVRDTDFLWRVPPQELLQDYAWQQRNQHVMRDRRGRLIQQQQREDQNQEQLGQNQKQQKRQQQPILQQQQQHQELQGYGQSQTAYSKSYGDEIIQRIKSKLGSRLSQDGSDSSFSENDLLSPTRSLHDDAAGNGSGKPTDLMHIKIPPPEPEKRSAPGSPVREVPIESVRKQSAPEHLETSPRERDQFRKSDPTLLASKHKQRVSISSPAASISEAALASGVTKEENRDINDREKVSEETDLPAEPGTTDPADPSAEFAQELRYLEMVLFLSNAQISRHNLHKRKTNADNSSQVSHEISEVSYHAIKTLVPLSNRQLDSSEQELEAVQHEVSSTIAPPLDNMLYESDRLLCEVSTNLNLEIRKTAERLDKLEGDSPSPVKWLYTVGYATLEWIMVILMWLAWLLVSTLLMIRGSLRCFISVFRWLIWC